MTSAIIVMFVVLATVVLLGAVLVGRAVVNLRGEIKSLSKRIEQLTKRVESQEAQIKQLTSALAAQQATDPIMEVWEALSGWQKNGPVRTLLGLGTRLFKSYSKQRKLKALPSKAGEEK